VCGCLTRERELASRILDGVAETSNPTEYGFTARLSAGRQLFAGHVVVNWTGTETLTPQCTEARLYENGTDRARDADAGAGAGARRLRVLRRLPARRREGVGHAHVHVRDDDALSGWAAAHCPIRSHSAVRVEAKLWQWAESRSTYSVTSRLRG